MHRESLIENVKHQHTWDFLIIGGGATGLWCALDASSRGYTALLIDKGDFASVTSSKSTKLFHGGLRYLKHGHLSLVKEALYERGLLERNAPSLMEVRPFLLPYYSLFEKFFYSTGMFLYDFLAGKLCLEKHHQLDTEECKRRFPNLKTKGLKGACIYYDGQFNDSRFAIELGKKAHSYGANLLNYFEFSSFIKENNQLKGIHAKDVLSGEKHEIFASHIINATGTYSDNIRLADNPSSPKLMSLSRGSHLVVDSKFLSRECAFVIPKTPDGRVIFMVPWMGKALIGTTDIAESSPKDNCQVQAEEVDYLLELSSRYFVHPPIKADIESVFSGIRPLVRSESAKNTAKLSRSHRVIHSASGLTSIMGGKWTTARKMAEDTIDAALKQSQASFSPCKTHTLPLENTLPSLGKEHIHPLLPISWEQLEYNIKNEMVFHLSDLLARRSRALFLNRKACLEIAPQAAKKIALHLKKDSSWTQNEIEKFNAFAKNFLPSS